ncbi:tetratricopeptide repeat protein [Paraburkholderia sp. CNPSo 3272]|nr:tetratricopeptide repeat protein [Paraburkholderia sp. CNPSo 3272]MCP3725228.1 tetratricopeptide repeat protein [Paraburkholderia sp. CNPSo 3272]
MLHSNRAIALADLGRTDDAELCYRGCLALDPSYADAHHHLAILLEKRGDKQGLVRHFNAYWASGKCANASIEHTKRIGTTRAAPGMRQRRLTYPGTSRTRVAACNAACPVHQ